MKYLMYSSDYKLVQNDDNETFSEIGLHFAEGDAVDGKNCLKEFIKRIYLSAFSNLMILTAAGSSMENGNNSGKTRVELWNDLLPEITKLLGMVPKEVASSLKDSRDVESVLSYSLRYGELGLKKSSRVNQLISNIEEKICRACSLLLDNKGLYCSFLDKLVSRRPGAPRVELFTTNYDTLFEQAANLEGIVLIDGFSYSSHRVFSGQYFDYDIVKRWPDRVSNEESFVPKVIKYYKLHGSVNWSRDSNNVICQTDSPLRPLIVYPSKEKFRETYEQPYFEMMSRFQRALRRDSTVLFVTGFGFADEHITNAIVEATRQNSGFHVVIFDYAGDGRYIDVEKYKQIFEGSICNVSIVYGKFSDFVEALPHNRTYSLLKEPLEDADV